MSGTKWDQNDYALPPHLIAPLPGRLGAVHQGATPVYRPFKPCAVVSGVTVTADDMMDSGFSRTCLPLVGFDLMAED